MIVQNFKKYFIEFLGTAILLATVIGSGIMGEMLSEGNDAIALLANTIATGAILYVLITMFGSISGAHFNPVVSLVFLIKKEIDFNIFILYIFAQVLGGLFGMLIAHFMFDTDLLQYSSQIRIGPSLWFSEFIAAFGLILTILFTIKENQKSVAISVGLYITAAYWFTASTSFANPAVTIARTFTDTFSGIHYSGTIYFIIAQSFGALLALIIHNAVYKK
ncbi:MAG: aquaporin [Alphaproteobacteria bacterium]|uniref:Aquaporin family protein n=1 Tax=PS1 clade bacterium TaxID=2175152 RepID=A0A368DPC4_9PROT|nr:aquaporin family protein [Rhodobiaceae bacterium]OUT73775.1 MAG: aquaporin family protein [Rhizobiales bacterium TMED25]RCL73687.1 MAG: aquaporin family protein [PS1 clade bacterium]|tara:strand:- start:2789 stop:3448 length:660 start_codon:yes stop_codon:yes gene_type:complete